MLSVYHSPTQLFSHVHFSLSSLHQLEPLAKLQQSPVPLQFPLPDVVIATDATPTHWLFYFQGSGLPLSVVVLGQVLCLGLILPCRNFRLLPSCPVGWPTHLSGKVVALHLDNSTAKAYLCNQGGTVYFSFPTGLPDTESDQQAWYYSSSSIHSYPPQ